MLFAKLATAAILLLLVATGTIAREVYPGGYTRFIYRTTTASARVELTTTEIIPLGDEQYSVQTTRQNLGRSAEIRLSFFGDASQSLGLYMGDDADSPFDLSPLGALADEVLKTNWTYGLADGWSLQTGEQVTVAGLTGVEGILVHADTPSAIVRVVLADDLYIRQFLPFPLRVELEYQETTNDGSIVRMFSGRVELEEYVYTADEEGTS